MRAHHDDPHIPDEITPQDLNGQARNELKTLSKENAEWVARHLAMAANLIDEDPALAHQHALSASRRAGRIAVVRETLAITAYATGDYALALRELRTYRRISGSEAQIALMVDSERGVGRPDRALEVGRGVDRNILPVPVRVELAIAMSGARLDLGEPERALAELDIPEFDPDRAYEWSPGLFSARATVLEELGRDAEAAEWHRRAAVAADAIDEANGIADLEVVFVEEIFEEGGDDEDAEEPVSNVEPEREPDVEVEAEPEQDTPVGSELDVAGDDDGERTVPEPEPSPTPDARAPSRASRTRCARSSSKPVSMRRAKTADGALLSPPGGTRAARRCRRRPGGSRRRRLRRRGSPAPCRREPQSRPRRGDGWATSPTTLRGRMPRSRRI